MLVFSKSGCWQQCCGEGISYLHVTQKKDVTEETTKFTWWQTASEWQTWDANPGLFVQSTMYFQGLSKGMMGLTIRCSPKMPLHSAPSNHNDSISGISPTPLTVPGDTNKPFGVPFLGLQIVPLLMLEFPSHWGTSLFIQWIQQIFIN